MTVLTIESEIDPSEVDIEDGGSYKGVTVCSPDLNITLGSYDETEEHAFFNELEGKRIRLTIEII